MGISATTATAPRRWSTPRASTDFGIGIGDYPVPPLDQAVGYATLAERRHAQRRRTSSRRRPTSDGEVVYQHTAKPTQAIDKRVANDVTLTLEPVAGVLRRRAWPTARQSAAKTGTVGHRQTTPNDDNSDAWMVGFTPQVSAAVWVGTGLTKPIYNADGAPMYGADLPGKTWKLFMDTYLDGPRSMAAADQAADRRRRRRRPRRRRPTRRRRRSRRSSSTPHADVLDHAPAPATPPRRRRRRSPARRRRTPPTPTPAADARPATCGGVLQPPCRAAAAATAPDDAPSACQDVRGDPRRRAGARTGRRARPARPTPSCPAASTRWPGAAARGARRAVGPARRRSRAARGGRRCAGCWP